MEIKIRMSVPEYELKFNNSNSRLRGIVFWEFINYSSSSTKEIDIKKCMAMIQVACVIS